MRSFYILIPTLTLANMGAARPHRGDRRQFHAADYSMHSPPVVPDGTLGRRGLFSSGGLLGSFFGGSSSSASTSTGNASNASGNNDSSHLSSITANSNSAEAGPNGATVVLGQGSGLGTTDGIPLLGTTGGSSQLGNGAIVSSGGYQAGKDDGGLDGSGYPVALPPAYGAIPPVAGPAGAIPPVGGSNVPIPPFGGSAGAIPPVGGALAPVGGTGSAIPGPAGVIPPFGGVGGTVPPLVGSGIALPPVGSTGSAVPGVGVVGGSVPPWSGSESANPTDGSVGALPSFGGQGGIIPPIGSVIPSVDGLGKVISPVGSPGTAIPSVGGVISPGYEGAIPPIGGPGGVIPPVGGYGASDTTRVVAPFGGVGGAVPGFGVTPPMSGYGSAIPIASSSGGVVLPSGSANSPVPGVGGLGGSPISNLDYDLSKDPHSLPFQPDLTSSFGQALDSDPLHLPVPLVPSDSINKATVISDSYVIGVSDGSSALPISQALGGFPATPVNGQDLGGLAGSSTDDHLSDLGNVVVSPFLSSPDVNGGLNTGDLPSITPGNSSPVGTIADPGLVPDLASVVPPFDTTIGGKEMEVVKPYNDIVHSINHYGDVNDVVPDLSNSVAPNTPVIDPLVGSKDDQGVVEGITGSVLPLGQAGSLGDDGGDLINSFLPTSGLGPSYGEGKGGGDLLGDLLGGSSKEGDILGGLVPDGKENGDLLGGLIPGSGKGDDSLGGLVPDGSGKGDDILDGLVPGGSVKDKGDSLGGLLGGFGKDNDTLGGLVPDGSGKDDDLLDGLVPGGSGKDSGDLLGGLLPYGGSKGSGEYGSEEYGPDAQDPEGYGSGEWGLNSLAEGGKVEGW
ncbi:hypothetical protein BKA70DRAFT_1557916 [Coprinopsis sp. MPI-PUGE-AT-0042]|nr:hypothetical protein BKA70DRAFT_1557916 [Coprinopsis sp. MPI-PUGE-AT-0042]